MMPQGEISPFSGSQRAEDHVRLKAGGQNSIVKSLKFQSLLPLRMRPASAMMEPSYVEPKPQLQSVPGDRGAVSCPNIIDHGASSISSKRIRSQFQRQSGHPQD
jgi:hypothetical protein